MIDWFDAFLGLGIGVLLGALAATALALKRRSGLVSQLANVRAERELLAGRIEARETEQQRLRETFTALGAEALKSNNEQFLRLASQTLDRILAEARGDVEKRQQAIEGLVRPVKELLEKHNTALREIEVKREGAYRGLEAQIKSIADSHERLGRETSRLVTALRRPERRGQWGEMQLRNVVSAAGMIEHCDFSEQPQTDDPETQDRPDMIVHIPGGGVIVIDAKVALDAYLADVPDEQRAEARRRHAEQFENHYRKLASRRYWDQFERTPKLVVMFVPLESALMAALDQKPGLHAAAMERNVLIATPTLLVAMLRAIAYGWQQESVAANARQIAQSGRELYERLRKFVEHFEGVGRAIDQAAGSYDRAVGSLEKRLLATARELKELDATTDDAIEAPRTLQIETRRVGATELKPGV